MAFEFRLGDTDPRVGQSALSPTAIGGASPVRPFIPENIDRLPGVSVTRTSSLRPGQGPKFAQAENIQGSRARQDPSGPGLTDVPRGGQGTTGSGLGDSIQGLASKFARAIRGTEFRPRSTTVEQFGGFEFQSATGATTPGVVSAPPTSSFFPTTSTTTAGIPSFLNEGGFIRKRT
jgi:hypothetical protein